MRIFLISILVLLFCNDSCLAISCSLIDQKEYDLRLKYIALKRQHPTVVRTMLDFSRKMDTAKDIGGVLVHGGATYLKCKIVHGMEKCDSVVDQLDVIEKEQKLINDFRKGECPGRPVDLFAE